MPEWLTMLIIIALVVVLGVGIVHSAPNQVQDFFSNFLGNALNALPAV